MAIAAFEVIDIPFDQLHSASWNANRVPKDVIAKIRRSLQEWGVVENSVVRPLPQPCPYCDQATEKPHYEIVSGNHRSAIYRDAGFATMPCVVRELDDANARMLAQVLNRTRGADDPDAYRLLLERTLEEVSIETVASFLPETEDSIRKLLADVPAPADVSGLGEVQLWGVVVELHDEAAQADLLERLTAEGYAARALML